MNDQPVNRRDTVALIAVGFAICMVISATCLIIWAVTGEIRWIEVALVFMVPLFGVRKLDKAMKANNL